MKKILLILFLISLSLNVSGQITPQKPTSQGGAERLNDTSATRGVGRNANRNTTNKNIKNKKAQIFDYKIISYEQDTTYLDTTLSIKKEYKYNYLRKDYLTLLPFNNTGQTFNTLSYDFQNTRLMPRLGARAKHFNYMEIEDVNYYFVPTPLTELMFKTVFEQGQLLDAFFTTNTSKQFNFSIAYKGLRSLGKYQHILTSTGNFRVTANYKTKNNRYHARAHIYMQDILNQENGGIQDEDIENFESGAEDFIDRSVFDPVFENAQSSLEGKRFYLEHSYALINKQDSLSRNHLKIGNVVYLKDKYYHFTQDSQNDAFGEAFRSNNLSDRVTLEDFYAEANAQYSNSTVGDLLFRIGYTDFNYGYDKIVNLNSQTITNRLKGNVISVGGEYKKQFGKLKLEGEVGVNVSGDFDGNFLLAQAGYEYNDDISFDASFNTSSVAPDYNFLLYQSDYINYNWANSLDNIETQRLTFKATSKKWGSIEADFNLINNYTYFKESETDKAITLPLQSDQTINYYRVKLSNEIRYRKFALVNDVIYQNVVDGEGEINVPDLLTRNTLYFSDHFFKKALFLQTGITFQYFTKYNMNAYNPLLGEFQVQNRTELGGFPRLDFFINAKVQQTRIYLKAEHFNSSLTGYNFYSAPNYPYRDFNVRFGLVWNFFL